MNTKFVDSIYAQDGEHFVERRVLAIGQSVKTFSWDEANDVVLADGCIFCSGDFLREIGPRLLKKKGELPSVERLLKRIVTFLEKPIPPTLTEVQAWMKEHANHTYSCLSNSGAMECSCGYSRMIS